MLKWFVISILAAYPALSGLLASRSSSTQQSQAPSPAELEARADKLTANQHQNDLAIEQYERIERQVEQTAGMNPKIIEDRMHIYACIDY